MEERTYTQEEVREAALAAHHAGWTQAVAFMRGRISALASTATYDEPGVLSDAFGEGYRTQLRLHGEDCADDLPEPQKRFGERTWFTRPQGDAS